MTLEEQIEELYSNQGYTIKEIAKALKIGVNRTKTLIKNNKWERSKISQELVNSKALSKAKKTSLNNYGVDNPAKSVTVKEKMKKTFINNYGVDNPLKVKKIRDKVKKTFLDKYGVDNPAKNKEIMKKTLNTILIKYGRMVNQEQINNIENYNYEYVLEHFIDKEGYFLNKEFCEYFNISSNHVNKLKKKWEIDNSNKYTIKTELLEFLEKHSSDIKINNRSIISPLEIDYLLNGKLAIEFDGLTYHSIGKGFNRNFKSDKELDTIFKYYHLNKTIACQEKGLTLFHIFENEWRNDRTKKIWKSVIKYKLQDKNLKRVYARKCKIREVDYDTSFEFLRNNHLQGSCKAKIRLGLYYENELVSLMTFSKPRFNKNYEWELIRFCNKIDTVVIGGASRLFRNFLKNYNPSSIISYANRRWSEGNLYEQLGFELTHESSPNYFYFKNNKSDILYSRNKCQKHKLSKLLENYNPLLTETENMYNHGYRKIYDCGNLVYSWNES